MTPTPSRWERVRALFHRSLDLPPTERRALLSNAATPSSLVREVGSLLAAHEAAEHFLERPAGERSQGPTPVRSARLQPGTMLGPFALVELLGTGGMGEVYSARDTRLDRLVAIKVLSPDLAGDPRSAAWFEREARAISTLTHPHICTLYDIGSAEVEHGTVRFLVMELLEGESLARRLSSGPLSLEEALKVGSEIASALAAAHTRGVVHRDLKPENIMLTASGVKLLDFGLASLRASGRREPGLTSRGMVFGTLPYMAPEQLRGEDTDGRTDLFAFGALLYEMVTGSRAFPAKSEASLIAQILEHHPPAAGTRQPAVPASLQRLIATCLAKDPRERWQHAQDVFLQLREMSSASLSGAGVRGRVRVRPVTIPLHGHVIWAAVALAVAFGIPRSGKDASPPPNRVPVVVLMDSPGLAYDSATRASGGSNADDLSDALRDLPVVTIKENTGSGWDRDEQLWQENPDLIISHLSSLLDRDRTQESPEIADRLFNDAQLRLTGILGYLGSRNSRTRFLVYSRSQFRTEDLQSAWTRNVVARFPHLTGRIFTMSMPGGRAKASFRDPATAEAVRGRVSAILGLTGKP